MKKSNKNQELAIRHRNGPCLVLAGPGSGKTFVLTNRILNLIENYSIDAKNILVITFTRAASDEMGQRFFNLCDSKGISIKGKPTFGTFHSVFFSILKQNFGYNSNSLISDGEKSLYLKKILSNYKNAPYSSKQISGIITDIDNYELALEKDESVLLKYLDKKVFYKIYRDYQDILFANRKLSFSNMISKCYELLKTDRKILEYYQNKYKYVLIDEFQDINKMQYNLVKLVCKSRNIFVVGDDDQSIYRFRGSHPKVMSSFIKDYKRAKIIYLNENYRCAKQIVRFSKAIIGHNRTRFDKDLVSNRTENGKIEIKSFVDSTSENKYIISLIKMYRNSGIELSDMAILYRTNLLVDSIKSELAKSSIGYIVKGEQDAENGNKENQKNDIYERESINLMTFHLSKGLEYKVIFIIDTNDGLIPHKKSILDDDLETERRLFYVALTRARDYLHIFFTTRRFGKDYNPSRFILEAIGG